MTSRTLPALSVSADLLKHSASRRVHSSRPNSSGSRILPVMACTFAMKVNFCKPWLAFLTGIDEKQVAQYLCQRTDLRVNRLQHGGALWCPSVACAAKCLGLRVTARSRSSDIPFNGLRCRLHHLADTPVCVHASKEPAQPTLPP